MKTFIIIKRQVILGEMDNDKSKSHRSKSYDFLNVENEKQRDTRETLYIEEQEEESIMSFASAGAAEEFQIAHCHFTNNPQHIEESLQEVGPEGVSSAKKRRRTRHSPATIATLEAIFRKCPHPNERERQELSQRLDLSLRQIRFWFQNRRTQFKAHNSRHENNILRQENENLRAENFTLRESMKDATCPTCSGPISVRMSLEEQYIRMENACMREQIDHLYGPGGKYLEKSRVSSCAAKSLPFANVAIASPEPAVKVGSDLGMFKSGRRLDLPQHAVSAGAMSEQSYDLTPLEKDMITELAMVAWEEFMKMVRSNEPLWVISPKTKREALDFEEYLNHFPRGIGPKPDGYCAEASRYKTTVTADAYYIMESFLDVDRWMELFPCIVTNADVGEIISTGAPISRDGALQLMFAEIQIPSPVVPTRQLYFLRFCKMICEGTWAIVDVSVDNLRGDSPSKAQRCRKRPSGCLIQQLANGFSKVTWVEHSEFDDSSHHHVYRLSVLGGLAFGAHRWLSTLKRQCSRHAILMINSLSSRSTGIINEEASKVALLKMGQSMTKQLCNSVSASWRWKTSSGRKDEVNVMTRESSPLSPHESSSMVLCAATSLWMPVTPQLLVEFLSNLNARKEWDVLSLDGPMEELTSVFKSQDPGNYVSVLRMLILQECCSDASGSTFVYAPVDINYMNEAMKCIEGANADYKPVPFLPSGFVIMPDGRPHDIFEDQTGMSSSSGGSLITIAFQLLVNSKPGSKLALESIDIVNSLVSNAVQEIKGSFLCDNSSNPLQHA